MILELSLLAALPRNLLLDLLERIRRVRLGVLGDFTLDGYWTVDMARAQLSRETPLFPRPVVRETYSNGGAANVAWNLADLGLAEVRAFTVLGHDWRGELLLRALRRARIEVDSVITTADWLTPFYGKVILTNDAIQQEDSRLDFVNTGPLPAEGQSRLLAEIEDCISTLDGLVVADYQVQGVVTSAVAAVVVALAKQLPGKLFMVDSRDRLECFRGLVLKPNHLEAARLLCPEMNLESISLEVLARAGLERQHDSGLPLFITLGSHGCLVLAQGQSWHIPALPVSPPLDPVGAGDTFLSAVAAALAAGADPLQAAGLANLASAVTVRKRLVTGTAAPQEILSAYDAASRG